MNCKNCGAPLKDGAKFCAGCGQTIKEPSPTPSAQPYSQPVQQNQYQPQQQNQQMYGGYAQNQQNYGYQGQQSGYGGYAQQGGFGGYSAQPVSYASSSGIKTILLLFMAAAMILSAFGLLFFPFAKSTEKMHTLATNSGVLCSFMTRLEANDGDLAETLEEMFEDEDDLMLNIGFIASVVLFAVSMLFYIVGLVCGLVGSHSGAAAIMGIGSLITAVGYLLVFIEGISYAAESEDNILEYSVSLAPLFMLLVSAAMFILACVSAGKMRKA